jgi:NitT/TauT family transport system substrate-binding protein
MRGIKWTRFLAALLSLSLLAAACGSDDESSSGDGGELTDVKLTLQWVTQAQFAGYYAALEQGFYEDEGLNVTIQPGGPDLNGVQLLISGQTDIAIRQFGDVLTARGTGAEVVSIGQTFERGHRAMGWFPAAGFGHLRQTGLGHRK